MAKEVSDIRSSWVPLSELWAGHFRKKSFGSLLIWPNQSRPSKVTVRPGIEVGISHSTVSLPLRRLRRWLWQHEEDPRSRGLDFQLWPQELEYPRIHTCDLGFLVFCLSNLIPFEIRCCHQIYPLSIIPILNQNSDLIFNTISLSPTDEQSYPLHCWYFINSWKKFEVLRGDKKLRRCFENPVDLVGPSLISVTFYTHRTEILPRSLQH